MRTNKFTAILLSGLLLTLPVAPLYAQANDPDRMAGSVPVSGKTPKSSAPAPAEQSSEAEADGELLHDINYAVFESYGLPQGGLGRDLWHGAKRSVVVDYLPQIPGLSPYRTMQDLSRRLLLTQADVELMERDERPQPGADLTTLRIEKLLEMGAYKQALALYNKHPERPYHERFARAGLLSALYSKQPALACLELKALGKQVESFEDVSFWQQAQEICDFILSNAAGSDTSKFTIAESSLLQQVVSKKNFRYKVRKLKDLQDLSPLEAAVLAADNRLDLSGLEISARDNAPQHVLALLLNEPSLPEEQGFTLMLRLVALGLKSPDELAAYYEAKALEHFGKDKSKTSLASYSALQGWKRLPYLYRAATNSVENKERVNIVRKLFEIALAYDEAALLPFARIISETDPEELDSTAIRAGFPILAAGDAAPPSAWIDAWGKIVFSEKNLEKSDFLRFYAYLAGAGSSANISLQDVDFAKIMATIEPHELEILKMLQEKLDKLPQLHNYIGSDVYEKDLGLTSSVDYVMPSTSLLEDLKQAEHEQRLGEVILLSAVALRDVPPEKLSPGVLSEVIDGLMTVGLTKEAQSLSREVMLSLSVK